MFADNSRITDKEKIMDLIDVKNIVIDGIEYRPEFEARTTPLGLGDRCGPCALLSHVEECFSCDCTNNEGDRWHWVEVKHD